MCEIGKQLPKIHVERQLEENIEYADIRKKMDYDGVPRMVDIDGHTFCKDCSARKTYQAYADYSWRSTSERCTHPEC